jgi:hypothetical protein
LVESAVIVAALLRFDQKKRNIPRVRLATALPFFRIEGGNRFLLRHHLYEAPFSPPHANQPDRTDRPAQNQQKTHPEQQTPLAPGSGAVNTIVGRSGKKGPVIRLKRDS